MGCNLSRICSNWKEKRPPVANAQPYHAGLVEGVSSAAVHRHAHAGVAVAEAAAPHHHVVQGVVVLVLGVPPPAPQQGVTQREQAGQVNPDVGQGDQLWALWERILLWWKTHLKIICDVMNIFVILCI